MKYSLFSTIIILLIFICGSSQFLYGQKLGRDVLSAQGGQKKMNNWSISYTIGQAGLTRSSSGSTLILHSGFEQENDHLFVSTLQLDESFYDISVFPNPSNLELNIKTNTDMPASLGYSLFGMQGECLFYKDNINIPAGTSIQKENLSSFPTGSYLMQIRIQKREGKTAFSTFKIIKK